MDETEKEHESSLKSDVKEDVKSTKGWSHSIQFTLATIGYVVGLGNIWRFAYVAYYNGGGSFVVAYWTCGLTLGVVLFSVECVVGQFGRVGPLKAWTFIPLFGGIGASMFMLSTAMHTYYCVIIAWCIFYFVKSFATVVPWANCDSTWSSSFCNLPCVSSCSEIDVELLQVNGSCFNISSSVLSATPVAIYNRSVAATHGIQSILPAEEYFYNVALAETPGVNFENLGNINVPIFCITVAIHVGMFFIYIFSVKGYGKAVYFTTLVPYLSLSILLINGFLIDGGPAGMKAFITPDFSRLKDVSVWQNACIQLFYSLGPVWGCIIGLSSFNKFHDNIVFNTVVTVVADAFTGTLSAVIIFAYLGHLSMKLGLPLDEVTASGPGLAFIIYPSALATLPGAPLWSGLFFFTLTIVGFSSIAGGHFTFIENFIAIFPSLGSSKPRRILATAGYLTFYAVASAPYTTQGGFYLLTFVDNFVGGWHLLLIAFCEVVGIAWILGWPRFQRAIGRMLPWSIEWKFLTGTYGILIRYFIPQLLLLLMASIITDEVPTVLRNYRYPDWCLAASHTLRVLMILPILIAAGYAIMRHRKSIKTVIQAGGVWTLPEETVSVELDGQLLSLMERSELHEKLLHIKLTDVYDQ